MYNTMLDVLMNTRHARQHANMLPVLRLLRGVAFHMPAATSLEKMNDQLAILISLSHWLHKLGKVKTKQTLHSATNLKHNQLGQEQGTSSLTLETLGQENILLCCMMFTTHWLHKLGKVPYTVCTALPT